MGLETIAAVIEQEVGHTLTYTHSLTCKEVMVYDKCIIIIIIIYPWPHESKLAFLAVCNSTSNLLTFFCTNKSLSCFQFPPVHENICF